MDIFLIKKVPTKENRSEYERILLLVADKLQENTHFSGIIAGYF
jgi:hypothetical protein